MASTSAPTLQQIDARPAIRAWLFFLAGLVFAMVIVGGAVRLTDSGLSITEWQPLLGAIPPLDEAHWQEAFLKYQQTLEYKVVNLGMSLAEFKVIYWWEWAHRFLGRLIGAALIVPLLWFWVTGRLERSLLPKLIGLFVLGGLQGALGWYMVTSGLVDRTDVSQYRLAAHLTLAVVIFAAIVWVALGVGRARVRPWAAAGGGAALAFCGLLLLQAAAGGFVAGLDAGMGYNTWPLMDGAFIPSGLGAERPWWRNLFENALTVQFQHRMLAYLVFIAAIALAVQAWARPDGVGRSSAAALLGLVVLQIVLGIGTLLEQVPIGLALMHQAGALLAVAAAVAHLDALSVRRP